MGIVKSVIRTICTYFGKWALDNIKVDGRDVTFHSSIEEMKMEITIRCFEINFVSSNGKTITRNGKSVHCISQGSGSCGKAKKLYC